MHYAAIFRKWLYAAMSIKKKKEKRGTRPTRRPRNGKKFMYVAATKSVPPVALVANEMEKNRSNNREKHEV